MDLTFWLGIVLGLLSSILFWYVTTKILTPKLSVSNSLERSDDREGKPRYRFTLRNEGHRDAVDVRVKCTLFSHGWARGASDEIAIVDIPVAVGQIDVMPGRRWPLFKTAARPLDILGDRIVSLQLNNVSEFQKGKLTTSDRARLENADMRLEDLMSLGTGSFLNVVVYGFDRFSGSRNVYSERYYFGNDIVWALTP